MISIKERNPYFDNAKLILIFLVVLGHVIEQVSINNPVVHAFYLTIYAFHMPAFAVISGYFSKHSQASLLRKVSRYFVLYVVFEFLFWPFFGGTPFIYPHWMLWYILSLVWWELLSVVIRKRKLSVVIALFIAVVLGYTENANILGVTKMLVFFPFFTLGYHLNTEVYKRAVPQELKVIAATIFAVAIVLLYFFPIDIRWFYLDINYTSLGHPEWYAGIYRLGIYALASILCLCLFVLTPRKELRLTSAGANSMNVYLLHGFFIAVLNKMSLTTLPALIGIPLTMVASAVLTLVLSKVHLCELVLRIRLPVSRQQQL